MEETDALDSFFSQYPSFVYNREASSPQEFHRMSRQFNWVKDRDGNYPPEGYAAWRRFRKAMIETFNGTFGTDSGDRASWERIGVLLNIIPLPRELNDLRQQVMLTHVNLCDMLDAERNGRKVGIFATEKDLVDYTKQNRKYFPKEEAYAGGLLKYLLREIDNKYHGNRRPNNKKRNGKRRGQQ